MPISVYHGQRPGFGIDLDAVVWRYMDIGKYLDIITKSKLWFARAIEFRKTDPYEGALTKHDEDMVTKILSTSTKEELKSILQDFKKDIAGLIDMELDRSANFFKLLILTQIPLVEMGANTFFISCWHENQSESDAMWALYAQRDAGIAIKTTVGRILQTFEPSKRNMSIAKVNYDSTGTLSALTSNMLEPLLIKRHAFHHEREVRIVAWTLDGYEAPEWTEENQRYNIDPSKVVPAGVYIDCDLDSLVEEVVVSPLMAMHTYQGS